MAQAVALGLVKPAGEPEQPKGSEPAEDKGSEPPENKGIVFPQKKKRGR